ncbi:tetracycline-efflux transporter [Penicillium canescens]|uniref:Tetracycline-efflux transporter n=1 Tax=Penicillium canescens TaxID=5083 RepID=A0AAD6I552_PENCN|nr:tetracycline-efflux transporter [Penicillium canescens]KAJ6030194.1 tetracycline-efflux transporter [Penicillium canescens]KAJ6060571.1 tetracycline-efflux transporter [Penicillium canescens]KAJ6077809.1 tetracycline-efflux transporter [Penicillium canescens]
MATSTDDTTPLDPDRQHEGSPDQSYQTFNQTHLLSGTQRCPSVNDEEESIDCTSTKYTSGKLLGSVGSIIVVLLFGEFVSNADSTIVMAAAGSISSGFNRLQDASWLATSFALGAGAVQLIYGKLSIIYGRKPVLLASYFLLALGCVICGIAPTMSIVIIGRVISGMGGAGIMTMGSIIILDVVPKRDFASWRAVVNISMTLGRSIGGPIGGWLTDTVGWRWVFLSQAPLLGFAAIIVIIFLRLAPRSDTVEGDLRPSVRRIDILGAILLASSVVSFTLLIDRGGNVFAWSSKYALMLAVSGLSFLAAFAYYESYMASEPIFGLRILRLPNVSMCYLISVLQTAAQSSMMFTIPLYFQVTADAPTTVAGAHLVPAVLGNAIGGLVAGWFIRRTGYYKLVLFVAGIVASITYLLLYLFWDGNTTPWQSLFIVPSGIGTAFASAASFVAMAAFLDPEEIIMATGGYVLLFSIAMTAGVTTSNSILMTTFKKQMLKDLKVPNAEEIIRGSLANTYYISGLTGEIRHIVVRSYVAGLRHTYLLSLALSLGGSVLGFTIRNHKL